jgi:hypothetical protein
MNTKYSSGVATAKPNEPRYGDRIEHAIVRALIEELAKAGFRPVGIHHSDLARGKTEPVTADNALRVVFEYDGPVTLHFAAGLGQGSQPGVFLVNGNKTDIISDWHVGPQRFAEVVSRVATAAHQGRFVLVVQS